MPQPHVLIVGAGITGLVLAQGLRKHNVPFTVFERDPDPYHRGRGWGLTIHWALENLLSLLPEHIIGRLPETYVDPEAVRNGENGNFLFFNLQTGEQRWRVPPNKRIRVAREKFRRLLMEGIDVKVSVL
jgi:flavin-dependent dehydrogenase